mgnify:CR=1 FL=1
MHSVDVYNVAMHPTQTGTQPIVMENPSTRFEQDAEGYLYDPAFRSFISKRLKGTQMESAEALRAVALAAKRVFATFEENLVRVGMTHAQFRTLMAVRYGSGAEAGVQMSHIAAWLGVTPRNVTGIVDALEAMGLVARVLDPRDRRAFMVQLTAAGDERATAALRVNEADQKRVLGALTESETKQLRHLCMKLVRSADEPAPPGR